MVYKNVLSLFSGCGGMDIGMEGGFLCLKKSINETKHKDWIESTIDYRVRLRDTGFKTVFANDIRPDAKAAWVSYFKKKYDNAESIYRLGSIVDLVKSHYEGEQIFPENVDIVTGGFPCQDFSVAGKRLGFNSMKSHDGKTNIDKSEATVENRGQLYIWMKEVVSIVKPKLFIAENVKGLVSLEDAKDIIENDFSTAADNGYIVVPAKVLQAADYGVPQSRERIFFFGFKKEALTEEALDHLENYVQYSKYSPYPYPTHSKELTLDFLDPYVTCEEAFVGLDEPDISEDISQTKYSKAKYLAHGQGNREVNLKSISPTIRSEHHGNIEFRRLGLSNGGKNIDELKSGMNERRLTIRECARLQTFPDDYQFILEKNGENCAVSASSAYKLIGNAVPCLLAYNIAMNLSEKWELIFK